MSDARHTAVAHWYERDDDGHTLLVADLEDGRTIEIDVEHSTFGGVVESP